jgi:hypothetical protein
MRSMASASFVFQPVLPSRNPTVMAQEVIAALKAGNFVSCEQPIRLVNLAALIMQRTGHSSLARAVLEHALRRLAISLPSIERTSAGILTWINLLRLMREVMGIEWVAQRAVTLARAARDPAVVQLGPLNVSPDAWVDVGSEAPELRGQLDDFAVASSCRQPLLNLEAEALQARLGVLASIEGIVGGRLTTEYRARSALLLGAGAVEFEHATDDPDLVKAASLLYVAWEGVLHGETPWQKGEAHWLTSIALRDIDKAYRGRIQVLEHVERIAAMSADSRTKAHATDAIRYLAVFHEDVGRLSQLDDQADGTGDLRSGRELLVGQQLLGKLYAACLGYF